MGMVLFWFVQIILNHSEHWKVGSCNQEIGFSWNCSRGVLIYRWWCTMQQWRSQVRTSGVCVRVTCVVVQMLYWLRCSPRLRSSLLSQQHHSPVGSNIHQTHRATSDLQAPRTDPTGWIHTHSDILTNRTWALEDTNCCHVMSYQEQLTMITHKKTNIKLLNRIKNSQQAVSVLVF